MPLGLALLPEFFLLLGIDIFLGLSLLMAALDDMFPRPLPYVFQLGAATGFGQLIISRDFLPIFTGDMRFWYSVVFLGMAVGAVLGLNFYLAMVRRRVSFAKVYSGTVTLPTLVTCAFFVSAYSGGGSLLEVPLQSVAAVVSVAIISTVAIFLLSRSRGRAGGRPIQRIEFPSTQTRRPSQERPLEVTRPRTTAEQSPEEYGSIEPASDWNDEASFGETPLDEKESYGEENEYQNGPQQKPRGDQGGEETT